MIIWDGVSSDDIGVIVEHYPGVTIPEVDIEMQHVPGRNDDIIISYGSFKNYDQSYSVFLDSKDIGGLEEVMPKLTNWLLGKTGYRRLEDSYFSNVYRMACFSRKTDFSSFYNDYGQGTLVFTCAPEKYYKSGDKAIEISSGQKLYNLSPFPAKPIIKIYGSGAGVITFSDAGSISISAIDEYVTIDVKNHRAYKGTTNKNSTITGKYEDMILKKDTAISWTGGITKVEVTPRWWTL